MQSTLTLEQRDERDAEQRVEFMKRPGSIVPQKKARTPMPEEYHRCQKRAVHFAMKLGCYSGIEPFPKRIQGDTWTAIFERGSYVANPLASKMDAIMKANERKARELAKQAKAAPIPRERALVVIS